MSGSQMSGLGGLVGGVGTSVVVVVEELVVVEVGDVPVVVVAVSDVRVSSPSLQAVVSTTTARPAAVTARTVDLSTSVPSGLRQSARHASEVDDQWSCPIEVAGDAELACPVPVVVPQHLDIATSERHQPLVFGIPTPAG